MQASERTKVVTLVHLIGPGGGETMAVESTIRLDPARFDRVLCVGRWHEFEAEEPTAGMLERIHASGTRLLRLDRGSRHASWSSRLAIRAWWPLLRLLRRERVDVLHGHLFGSNLAACVLGRLARVPVVVCHEHMWSYRGGRLRRFIDRWLIARWSDAFVAVSESGRRSMVEEERIPQEDVVLLRNGVPPIPAGDPQRARAQLRIGSDQPVLVAIGHLRPEKAYEVLIEAAARLAPALPGLTVLIAGEGSERRRLETLIDRLGLTETVTLLGLRGDVPDLLAAADVGVCCSDFEGGPLSVIEYMGAGLPVIATAVGGLPELVRDGETGVLVPPRDPDALATAIAALIADPSQRARIGAAARQVREREYGIDRYMQRLEALYERLLARRRLG